MSEIADPQFFCLCRWVKKDIPTVDEYAPKWMELGANVIGGCCEIGPDVIRKLRAVVDKWNKAQC